MIRQILNKSGEVVAIIFKLEEFKKGSTYFLTPEDWGIQVGISNKTRGYKVRPHYHIRYKSECLGAELLCVIKGEILVKLYELDKTPVSSEIINEGSCIVMRCAHSVEFLKDSILLETKEGPYNKNSDKVFID